MALQESRLCAVLPRTGNKPGAARPAGADPAWTIWKQHESSLCLAALRASMPCLRGSDSVHSV